MARFAVRRSVQVTLTLLLLAVASFGAVRTAPGGPAQVLLGPDRTTPELEQRLNRQLGLDRPLPEQFVRWTVALSRGDFGQSYFFRRPAAEVVAERLPATLVPGGLAFLLSLGVGVTLGVWAAQCRDTWLDRLLSSGAIATVAGLNLHAPGGVQPGNPPGDRAARHQWSAAQDGGPAALPRALTHLANDTHTRRL